MRAVVVLAVAAGCNLTPTPWPDLSTAPGGRAPWGHPTDVICEHRDDVDQVEIDGYLFCGQNPGSNKVPVDDPIYAPCRESRFDGDVMAVFDGQRARAYAIARIKDRELVNDDWDGEPLLVDF
jgi:hypothetical protein